MRKKSIFWGIVLIGTAALIIFDAFGKSMGFLDINGLPVIRIILGILCLAWP